MSAAPLLCIAGGGTGGHVMPACALADTARRHWPGLEVEFIGAERGLEASLLPERGESVLLLAMHSVQGAGMAQKLRVLMWELPRAVLRIWRHWRRRRPRLVVGVGGYASVAGVAAAVLRRIPVVLYEQNAVPGMVNRRLAPFCGKVALGFAEAASELPDGKCVHTGNLVNPALRQVVWQAHTPPRLLVLGGSQGAVFFNETLPEVCARLRRAGHIFTVTHVAGASAGRVEQVSAAYREAGVEAEVIEFCSEMPALYASGDLLVARAGAMTVSEAATVGMPALFIPLPHAADHHQHRNAGVLADRNGAIVLEQGQSDGERLAEALQVLFQNERLAGMSRAAREAVPADTEERFTELLAPWLGVQP
ncbi:MAG TPA: undecaprenyldiphospho-muramoylpentapeptide beta-N-acetylglucosaminyltransferase [Mariprofundaceae bacterium]|nr:undecaprenyldiphospho-muramoylpentapeptide beta-N-acetylglucosaminyltransferase [Mariprofundaceae bacterium]